MSPPMTRTIVPLDAKVLGIFVEVLRHIMQVQYLFMVACDDLIEWRLQVHPQGQDPEVSHVLSLCRRQVLPETIGQRTQRSFGLLEVLLDGRFQNREVLRLVTARSRHAEYGRFIVGDHLVHLLAIRRQPLELRYEIRMLRDIRHVGQDLMVRRQCGTHFSELGQWDRIVDVHRL